MAERQPADRGDLEALFMEHRDDVAHLAGTIARRHGLRGEDADDFIAWVTARLIERDYELFATALREARDPRSYLATVVANLGHEYRNQLWGRWRASAAARRQGPVAVRLELLVYRDGLRLDEAAQTLRSAGLTALSDRELAAMLAACPARTRARPARPADGDAAAAVEHVPDADAHADARVLDAEAEAERRSVGGQLAAALAELPAEEQVIVRLRYWEALSVADVARALNAPQKPLYRRLERVLAGLRAALERRGVHRDGIRALLGESRPPDADDLARTGDPTPPPRGGLGRVGDARPPPRRDSGPPRPSL